MKATFLIIAFQLPTFLFAQVKEGSTFLIYKKTVFTFTFVGSIRDINEEITSYDTTFWAEGILVFDKSRAHTRRFNITDNKRDKLENWQIKVNQSDVTIGNRKTLKGKIVYDSIFNDKNLFNYDFILTPITKGLQLPNFSGQLIYENGNDKIILNDYYDEDGLQRTNYFESRNDFINNNYGMTNYSISKEINLVPFGGNYQLFQLIRMDTDSTMLFNSFGRDIRLNDTIKKMVKLKKESLPTTASLDKKEQDLQGDWHLLSGSIFNDSTLEQRNLNDCIYGFSFRKDKLIVMKTFTNSHFESTNDTLNYSINPSGDYLNIEKNQRPSNQKLIL